MQQKSKCDKYPRLLPVVVTCWAMSLFLVIGVVVSMRLATGLPRIVPMDGLQQPDFYDTQLTVESDREHFKRELTPLVSDLESTEAKVLLIQEWVMNQIPKVEDGYSRSSWKMVVNGRRGHGVLCGGIAQILKDALLANDVPARTITFQRNLFDLYDTHAAVEAWVNGKWRLYDPSFHILLRASGQGIGAYEARDWFIKGLGAKVDVIFLGEVAYPPRLETYPIRYSALFNNVYVDRYREPGIVSELPIIGAWLSRELVYPANEPGLSSMPQVFYRRLYFMTLVILPSINVVLFILMLLAWKKRQQTQPRL